jgi:Tol biopolymer transport system component
VSAQPAQAWSPDGERIAFVRQAELYVINADGSGQRLLANATETVDLPAWSPDGEKIAFPCPAAPGAVGTDLCVMNADGTEWKRLASKVAPQDVLVAASWGRG